MEFKWSKGKARYIDLQPVAKVTPIGSLDNGVMCIMGSGGRGVTSADWHKSVHTDRPGRQSRLCNQGKC